MEGDWTNTHKTDFFTTGEASEGEAAQSAALFSPKFADWTGHILTVWKRNSDWNMTKH